MNMKHFACPSVKRAFLLSSIALVAGVATACAQDQTDTIKDHRTTEIYSPVPPVVTPGAQCGEAPSDAVVLFDGKNLDKWVSVNDGGAAKWIVENGAITVNKKAGNIQTKESFSNYQLHIEYKIPANITGQDQARGNSGIFLASTGKGDDGYELQVLDNYNNKRKSFHNVEDSQAKFEEGLRRNFEEVESWIVGQVMVFQARKPRQIKA